MRQIVYMKNGAASASAFGAMMKFIQGRRTVIRMEVIAKQPFPSKKIDRLILRFPVVPIRRARLARKAK